VTQLGDEIRRPDDGELLGYVRQRYDGDEWQALTVFGAEIGTAPSRQAARTMVVNDGLASLAKRWFHRSAVDGAWRVVVLTETWPGRARGVVGMYAIPGAPPFEVSADDLVAGDMMTLDPPTDDVDLSDEPLLR
jgi:hypothetical protein